MSIYYVSMLFLTVVHHALDFPSRIVKNKQFAIVVCILLIGILGLRDPSVGVDTMQYQSRFEQASELVSVQAFQSEFGFNYLNYFFHSIGFSFQAFLFVLLALYVIILVSFLYKYSTNVYQSAMYYITIGTFTMAISGLRQTIASAILLIAMHLTLKRKHLLWAALAVLAAYTIHNSAIVLLPFLLLRNVRLKRLEVGALIAASTLVLIYRNFLFPVVNLLRPARYADIALFSTYKMNPLLILISISIPVFCLLMIPSEDQLTGRYDSVTSNLFIYSCVNIFFTILTLNNNQIGRLAYYFNISNLILIPLALKSIKDSRWRLLLSAAIMLLCVLVFLISTPGGTLRIDQYKFFWH